MSDLGGRSGAGTRGVIFFWGQVPFTLSVLALVVLAALAAPTTFADTSFLVGLVLTLISTLAAATVPWERFIYRWVVIVAIADLVAVVLLREAVISFLPSGTVILLYPILWLSFGFSARAIPVAVLGSFVISVFPFFRAGNTPTGTAQWADVLLLPIVMLLISVSVHIATRLLSKHQAQLASASKELQQLLDASTDQTTLLRAVTDAVDAGIVFFDTEDRPVLRNHVVTALLDTAGYDADTGSAVNVYARDRQTRVEPEKQPMPRALRGDPLNGDLYWIGAKGNQQAILTNSRRVARPNGDPLGTVLVAYDVTNLANAIAVREQFLTTVSHELRTPLTSIVGYLDIIEELHDPVALGIGAEVKIMHRNAEQLLNLIGDLLMANSGDLTLRFESVDVTSLLRGSMDALQPRAEAAGLTLHPLTAATAVQASGDARRISQVFDNVLSNAVKYTPAGGSISCNIRAEGGNATVCITDTGRGISQEDQLQLFDPFFRARTARDDAIQGVGLGLSIVKTIVEAHRATLSVDSELGQGTTITLRFPLSPQGTYSI